MSELNPTDVKALTRAQKEISDRARSSREEELADLASVLNTESGRRFVWRLMEMSAIYRNAYTGNAETYVNCGRQLLGQTLLADMQTDGCFDKYLAMQKEARNRAKQKNVHPQSK